MKVVKNVVFALLIVTAVVSCKKDKTETSFSIHGKWEGKIGTGVATPSGQFAININTNGSIDRIGSNGSVSAIGSWLLTGNDFTATYHYTSGTIVSINGTVDKSQNKLSGTWENDGNEEGTWYATKTNK